MLRYEFPLCIWMNIVFKFLIYMEKVLEITMITNKDSVHDLEEKHFFLDYEESFVTVFKNMIENVILFSGNVL